MVAITDIYVNHPNPRLAAYCSTKAGLDSLAQSWVRRLAPEIRVNSIQPGPILFLEATATTIAPRSWRAPR